MKLAQGGLVAATKTTFSVFSVPQSFNTEHTERLSDLCVETVLTTEDTEALLRRGEIVARRQETG
jgi:hypothetical protein